MKLISRFILFLFDQKTSLVVCAIASPQILVAVDTYHAFLSADFNWIQPFVYSLMCALVALLIMSPGLLLLARIVMRIARILNWIYTIILLYTLVVIAFILSRVTAILGGFVFTTALHLAETVLVSVAVLFLIKGKSPLFENMPSFIVPTLADLHAHAGAQISTVAGGDDAENVSTVTGPASFRQRARFVVENELKNHLPFLVFGLIVYVVIFFNVMNSSVGVIHLDSTDQRNVLMAGAGTIDDGRTITSALAKTMNVGSIFDFSDCIGKTLHECVSDFVYAEAYWLGLKIDLLVRPEPSCGPRARAMSLLRSDNSRGAGCWEKHSGRIQTWFITGQDANGNSIMVRGPYLDTIEVLPYYKVHAMPNLVDQTQPVPEMDIPPKNISPAPSPSADDDFDENDTCLARVMKYQTDRGVAFDTVSRQAVKHNCATKRKEWLCYVEKRGTGSGSSDEEMRLRDSCALND